MGKTGIAGRLAAVRGDRGWSQRVLAGKSGLSYGMVSRVERGERVPSVETIRALAEALGVSAHYLETGDTEGDYVYQPRGGAAAEKG